MDTEVFSNLNNSKTPLLVSRNRLLDNAGMSQAPVPGASLSIQQYSVAVRENVGKTLPRHLMLFPAEAPKNQHQRFGILLASAVLAPLHSISSSPGKSSLACTWSYVCGLHQSVLINPYVTSQHSDTSVTKSQGKERKCIVICQRNFHFLGLDLRSTSNELAEVL